MYGAFPSFANVNRSPSESLNWIGGGQRVFDGVAQERREAPAVSEERRREDPASLLANGFAVVGRLRDQARSSDRIRR